jgi:hypothetical protein
VIAAALYVQGVVWNAATTRGADDRGLFFVECSYLRFPVFTRAALLSLAATALGIGSHMMLRAQPPAVTPSSPTPASGGPGPKPDAAGEAVAVPGAELQWSARGYGAQRQGPFSEVPRQPVEGYGGRAWNPPQSSRPPQREAQPAFEVMMA